MMGLVELINTSMVFGALAVIVVVVVCGVIEELLK